MAKSAYPTGADLSTFLLAAGFNATFVATLDQGAAGNLNTFALAGWEAFNEQAGRQMLAASQVRHFDRPRGPRGVLDLQADVLSVASVTDASLGALSATDWRLEPLNAGGDGRPYNRLRLQRYRWGYGGANTLLLAPALAIDGVWGYGTTIPEDAWTAMLAMAGLQMFPLIQQLRSRGMQAWREADMAETYGVNPLKGLSDSWMMQAMMTAGGMGPDGTYHYGRYSRVVLGSSPDAVW